MSNPLDYRTPGVGASRRQKILAALQQTEAMDFAALATRLGSGLGLSLLPPFFISTVAIFICTGLGWRWPVGFVSTVLLMSFLIVPWLMWYERRTHGGFYADAARDHGNPYDADSFGEYKMNQTRVAAAAYVEIALTGPRLLWEFIDRLRGRGRLDMTRLTAAAGLAEELLDAGQGVEIRGLVTAERPMPRLRELIDFLKHHDWADTSTDGNRVWIRSDVSTKVAGM